jgi:hypothetical protein
MARRRIFELQYVDGLFQSMAVRGGQDVGAFSEAVLDDIRSMP